MADVGDEAIALLVDERLVGAAALQVAVADQLHVALLGGLLLLRGYARMPRECDRRQTDRRESRTTIRMSSSVLGAFCIGGGIK